MSVMVNEQYVRGMDVLNFVIYMSTAGSGHDRVLQHKRYGVEFSHLTLHPDGTVNFTAGVNGDALELFVNSEIAGFEPRPSLELGEFLRTVRGKPWNRN